MGGFRISPWDAWQRLWASVLVDQGTKGLLKAERLCCAFPLSLLMSLLGVKL